MTPTKREFSQHIKEISPEFVKIYNAAYAAEQAGEVMRPIVGNGYRRALEFLIKDYAIKPHPEKEEQIKKKTLSNCIKEDIDSENIREIARRAAWLGNDEAHYVRKWQDKDLEDLKKLIDMTLYWINETEEYGALIIDMPEPANKESVETKGDDEKVG